jgi:polysaccharide biosynthesis protein PslH
MLFAQIKPTFSSLLLIFVSCFGNQYSNKKMRILQLSKKFPYPLQDGESIAVTALCSALHTLGCELTLLVMSTPKHPVDTAILPPDYAHYATIYQVAVNTNVYVGAALRNLFTNDSYNIVRFESAAFAERLTDLLRKNEYDIIWLETLFLAPYVALIRQLTAAKIVMRSHNVEYEIWERMAANETFLPKQWYLRLLAKRLKNYETAQLNKYDYVVGITARDNALHGAMGCNVPMLAAPVGIDLARYIAAPNVVKANELLTFGFLGSLDWLPNIEGVTWFVTAVWNKFVQAHPQLHFDIAGRNAPANWQTNTKNGHWQHTNLIGEISDPHQFIVQHNIMLAPSLSGSGIKIKVLEAMALQRVVITTTIGAEGIPAQHGVHFFIADDAATCYELLEFCYRNPEKMTEIGHNARLFIQTHFDKVAIAKNVLQFLA